MDAREPARTPGAARRASGALTDGGLPLGRWFGVTVRAHWSLAFTVFLFAALLAGSMLPSARPHHSTAAYWVAGSITSAVFFAFLLAHELAHAVVARRHGVHVSGITLWMLGGATQLDGEPRTARADAWIAASGPLTTLALGAVTLGLSVVFSAGLVGACLAWLGTVSLVLAVFNLLPGAPLDGGRLMRALLWAHYGDRARAATSASRAGRSLGIALVVLGVIETLAGSLFGLWLVLLGWFVVTAAAGEQAAVRTAALHPVPAREVMSPAEFTAPDWWTVAQLVAELPAASTRQPAFPLRDFGGQVTGVVTLADLVAVPADQRDVRRLREIARLHRLAPVVVGPEVGVDTVAPQLARPGGVVVIADGDQVLGVITGEDVERASRLMALQWWSRPLARS